MRILKDNQALTATIVASSENPNYPFATNLVDLRLIKKGRTLSPSTINIKFSYAAPITINYVAIMGHNLTSSAVVYIQGNATDVWTAPSVNQVLTVADTILYGFGSNQTYQYWRITIDDPTNPDTDIAVGLVYLGVYSQFPIHSIGHTFNSRSNSLSTSTIMGVNYGIEYPEIKGVNVDFLYITNDERLALRTYLSQVNLVTPFLMIFWDNDTLSEPPVYCKLIDMPEYVRVNTSGTAWNTKLRFIECK